MRYINEATTPTGYVILVSLPSMRVVVDGVLGVCSAAFQPVLGRGFGITSPLFHFQIIKFIILSAFKEVCFTWNENKVIVLTILKTTTKQTTNQSNNNNKSNKHA